MTVSRHGRALTRRTARALAQLPERVRIIWPHHGLYGTKLLVHGWQRIDGEIHLRVTLADGSVGCLPAAWTDLFAETVQEPAPRQAVSLKAIRALRLVIENLAARHAIGNRDADLRPPA